MQKTYDPQMLETAAMFFLFMMAVCMGCFFLFLRFERLLKKEIISDADYTLIRRLSILYICLEATASLSMFFAVKQVVYAGIMLLVKPLLLISNIIPVYIAALLFYRKYHSPANQLDDQVISTEEATKRIFNSQHFYTAIATVLPVGKQDQDYGFDYIPFMLQNIQDRRRRFQKSSRAFLLTTIGLSLLFVSITIFFGYILLNESSVGIYKELDHVNAELVNTNTNLGLLKKDLSANDYLVKTSGNDLEKLATAPGCYAFGDSAALYVDKLSAAVYAFYTTGDFETLYSQLGKYRDSLLQTKGEKNTEYVTTLNKTYGALGNFKKFKESGISDLNETQARVRQLLVKAEDTLNKPANTQSELLKRITLSIVVISFFIAILRYFRGLYQSHYQEMIKAENEDLLIRKFYVTFKSSGTSEERQQVLVSFLNGANKQEAELPKRQAAKPGNEALNELLNAILKKI